MVFDNKRRTSPSKTPLLKRHRAHVLQRLSTSCCPSFEGLSADLIGLIGSFLDTYILAQTLNIASRSTRRDIDDSHIWDTFFADDFSCFLLPVELLGRPTKSREVYGEVRTHLSQFRNAFGKKDIHSTHTDREVVYLNTIIVTEHLKDLPSFKGVYVEISVRKISDNLSFCLVDFDGEGTTSLTFSPDAGAVIRESQTNDEEIVGEYAAVLRKEKKFGLEKDSKMAVFISAECKIAFMRYFGGKWESTGEVTDCNWVAGGLLTPCLAFKDAGQYHINIEKMCISERPPHIEASTEAPVWKPLLWQVN